DLGLGILDLEQLAARADGLRWPEEEKARGLERVMQQGQQPSLQARAHVDHHVAAADDVHAREWRIAEHVVASEDADLAERLGNAIAAVGPHEEAPQPLR